MRYIFIVLLLVGMAVMATGQNRDGGEDRDQPFTEAIAQLDLSPLQQEKIVQLRAKYRDLMAHQLQFEGTDEERRAKRQGLQRDFRIELGEILTPSQEEELRGLLRSRTGTGDHRKLVHVLANMDLTTDQRTDIRKLLQEQRPKVAAILQSNASQTEKENQLQSIRHEIDHQLSTILTTGQYESLQLELKTKSEDTPPMPRRGRRDH